MKYKGHQNNKVVKSFAFSIVFLCVSASLRLNVTAQVRPVNDYGAIGLAQLLKRLNTTASVMMIGAHPDDEDSALLAYLARGENARTAYLSLTRGDGGQNIIGPELFESLGVIRTEELLQARRLDGAEQYFTRAFDYGFSKTLAEARQKWDEKVIVCDTVRAIRTFRPLVVISRFSGTPADGHGQHQYSGYISPIAVKAAADPKQCTETGSAWQVLKFYVEQGFGGTAQAPLQINTGAYDPILGRTYFEIAMEGRSQHKSQGEGRLELKGDIFSGLNLSKDLSVKTESGEYVLSGFGIPINSIGPSSNNSEKSFMTKLNILQEKIDSLNAKFRPVSQVDILPELLKASTTVEEMELATENSGSKRLLSEIRSSLNAALVRVVGLQIDALSERETMVSGDVISATVNVFFPKANNVKIKDISLMAPLGWEVSRSDAPKDGNQGFNRRELANQSAYFNLKVGAKVKPTQPYWLESPRDGDFFRWPDNSDQTLPFSPPAVTANVTVEIDGKEITFSRPVQFRYADAARGEIRRDINIVPALSVSVDQKLLIVPASNRPQRRTLTVNVTNNSSKSANGNARLSIDGAKDWKITAAKPQFELKNKGEKTSVTFDVMIPAKAKPGNYTISANATVGESVFDRTMNIIAYPHIQTHRFYTRAETAVDVLDLKVTPVKVGYIMGSGDDVPEAIRQIGLDVTLLDEKALATGDLAKYDTIVVGIRASETRPDFVANNQRLLDYVKNGGNLIVQYQRGGFAQQNLLPFPASMTDTQKTTAGTTARVVDENAKVTILKPEHPVFNFPNKIGDDDFKAWVQERNAYNLTTFDANYTPLLESHDAGEMENNGGLVVANVGKGTYIYCSYSFFRQLPAGVTGAYRLFANLLSLPKADLKH